VKCHICDNEESMPFRCRYCGRDFCSVHRLPPNHDCPMIDEFLARPAREREFIERAQGRAGTAQERVTSTLRNAVILRFSKLELVHLIIGTALVTAVGLSLIGYRVRWDFLAIFVSAFLIHEFGHKFLAQMYHSWAEFRLFLFGAAVTAFSALPILGFKFIAPGAVMVGPMRENRLGKVAWIGPLTNLAMGAGFAAAYYLAFALRLALPVEILAVGAWFNGWIALFNLIPFMGLDGAKILSWNKIIWVLTLAGAVGLFLVAEALRGGVFLGFLGRLF
jgi:Zn-dependent protease